MYVSPTPTAIVVIKYISFVTRFGGGHYNHTKYSAGMATTYLHIQQVHIYIYLYIYIV